VGAIAAALAKAQLELVNPEKSLEGTVPAVGIGGGSRSFRYAPLSTGLDIIRKSLGRHEIAVVQTTEIDRDAALVRLTTVLAHSSGEWLSSEWPVCPISDTASPQRMGAALTYARRYALFTLVGIAGEDDLDAPDLGGSPRSETASSQRSAVGASPNQTNSNGQSRRLPMRSPRPVLAPEQSRPLRDKLIEELAILEVDDAVAWAYRTLPLKNTLTGSDAQAVEETFAARLSSFQIPSKVESPEIGRPVGGTGDDAERSKAARQRRDSITQHLKTSRLRDKEHRCFVSRQPCIICGRAPSDAHHLRFAQPRALGLKVSDEYTVPVCRVHHRELHRHGNEADWWAKVNIEPVAVALSLWRQTRPHRATGSGGPETP
jgi:hypothetical protein